MFEHYCLNMKRILILVGCSVALMACEAHKLAVVKTPSVEKEESALIKIQRTRTRAGANIRQYVLLDGLVIAELENAQHAIVRVSGGNHVIGLKCYRPIFYLDKLFLGSDVVDDGFKEIKISLSSGEEICLKTSVGLLSCVEMVLADTANCKNVNIGID